MEPKKTNLIFDRNRTHSLPYTGWVFYRQSYWGNFVGGLDQQCRTRSVLIKTVMQKDMCSIPVGDSNFFLFHTRKSSMYFCSPNLWLIFSHFNHCLVPKCNKKTNKTRMNKQAKNQSNKHDNMILFFSGNRSWWSAGSRERQFQGRKAETQVSLYSHVSSLVLISVLSCLRTWEGMQTCAGVVGWGVGRKVG